mgnify:CR=1 FL=1
MPKSRNRKNHKKKVSARKLRVESQQKQMIKQLEEIKTKYAEEEAYIKKMAEDAKSNPKEDSGDVPFTLGAK